MSPSKALPTWLQARIAAKRPISEEIVTLYERMARKSFYLWAACFSKNKTNCQLIIYQIPCEFQQSGAQIVL